MIVALFFLLHSPRDLREILRSPCLSYKAPVMQASNWSSFAVLERQKNEHRRQRQSHSSRNRAKTSSRKSPSPLAVSVSRQCWRISNACRKTGQHQHVKASTFSGVYCAASISPAATHSIPAIFTAFNSRINKEKINNGVRYYKKPL